MRFLTIDWGLNYKHYAKDVGMIPYLLEKNYNYSSTILGTNIVDNYTKPYNDYNVNTEIVYKKYKSDFLNICKYIYENAKNIDCLNIYHMNAKRNYILAHIYKKENPKGIIYLKLDMGYRGVRLLQKDIFYKYFFKKNLLKKIDIISDENSKVCDLLKKIYKVDIHYIPNGWYGNQNKYYGERNIDFLYVGRIGIKEKGVDILLEAYKLSDLQGNLYLVGKVEPSFQNYLNSFFCNNPELTNKVHILGEIRDLDKLNEIYNRTKILIVPSRWESFGIVMVEAQAHGCYIIASDQVSSAHDVILDKSMGCLFESENSVDLANKMNSLNNYDINMEAIYLNSLKFNWDEITSHLFRLLNQIRIEREKI